jgi:hypothetical protein
MKELLQAGAKEIWLNSDIKYQVRNRILRNALPSVKLLLFGGSQKSAVVSPPTLVAEFRRYRVTFRPTTRTRPADSRAGRKSPSDGPPHREMALGWSHPRSLPTAAQIEIVPAHDAFLDESLAGFCRLLSFFEIFRRYADRVAKEYPHSYTFIAQETVDLPTCRCFHQA